MLYNNIYRKKEDDKSEISVTETSKSLVIDTACTKTVVGEKWFKNYTSNLTETSRKETTYPSNISFKFVDVQKVQALKWVVFPVLIAGKHCKISAEIVVENIPLLLSKSPLKKVQNSTKNEWW